MGRARAVHDRRSRYSHHSQPTPSDTATRRTCRVRGTRAARSHSPCSPRIGRAAARHGHRVVSRSHDTRLHMTAPGTASMHHEPWTRSQPTATSPTRRCGESGVGIRCFRSRSRRRATRRRQRGGEERLGARRSADRVPLRRGPRPVPLRWSRPCVSIWTGHLAQRPDRTFTVL